MTFLLSRVDEIADDLRPCQYYQFVFNFRVLFRDLLGLSGSVWLPLGDRDENPGQVDIGWASDISEIGRPNIFPYATESGTTEIGDVDNSRAAVAIGSSYGSIVFIAETVGNYFNVCEYCPS